MKQFWCFAVVFALAWTLQARAVSADADSSGSDGADSLPVGQWQVLFDGKSLDGWAVYAKRAFPVRKWLVENGELKLSQNVIRRQNQTYSKHKPFSRAKVGREHLIFTGGKFKNFELQFEWKLPKRGDAGVHYLASEGVLEQPRQSGPEFQLLDNDNRGDGRYAKRRTGAIFDVMAPRGDAANPSGEWNKARIIVWAGVIEHWLNGVRLLGVRLGGEDWIRRVADSRFSGDKDFGKVVPGYIVLQDNHSAVSFRNIRIRRLPNQLSEQSRR